ESRQRRYKSDGEHMKTLYCLFLMALLLPAAGALTAQDLRVTNLRCEYRSDPSGIADLTPLLSWQLESGRWNVLQRAYRILVADRPQLLLQNTGNIWDSKKIRSAASTGIEYGGQPLLATKTYHWKLMVWDNRGHASSWSRPASWQMGL